jgi:2-polyprenyl-3-methyl-5-hydroxy-6-metoxy-1,4-benzoquinol methylase
MSTLGKISKNFEISFTEYQRRILNNKQLNRYVPPSSNKQISTLLNFNKPAIYYRLCQLICKFSRSNNFSRIVHELLKNKERPDIEIYQAVFQISSQKAGGGSKEFVAEYLLNILFNFNIKPKSLLDIGCGNCILTCDLGHLAGMNNADIYGADVPEEFEEKWEAQRPKGLNFVTIKNNKLQFDRKFDLITCIMVLHHVPVNVLEQYITDIYKLLNSNGIFLIKEHDCINAIDYMMADIEHSLYIVQESQAPHREILDQTKKKILNQDIHYKNRFEWRSAIQKIGFKCIYEEPYDLGLTKNYPPTRGYIALFKK